MSGQAVYAELKALPACEAVASKMKYFVGHKHCNYVMEPNVGFMVGAQGMSDSAECGGTYGIPVLDTTEGTFKVFYFPIYDLVKSIDNYDKVLSCFKEKGVSGCYDLAEVWAAADF